MASKKPFNKNAVIPQWFAGTAGNPEKDQSAYEDAFPNGRKLRWQNAAGSGYVDAMYVDGSNNVVIGTPVAFTGALAAINDTDGDAAIVITANAGTAVNAITVANGATGVAPSIIASGETNVSLEIGAKGTGTTTILDGNGLQVLIAAAGTASAVNEVTITNAATGAGPSIAASGETNVPITLKGKGTGKVLLGQATTGGVQLVADQPILDSAGLELIKFVKTSTAVNEITVTNNSTGAAPTITASGETNVSLKVGPKGTGTTTIMDGNGNEVIVAAAAVTDAVNEITFTNSATAGFPGMAATGDDTNISMTIGAKGTGWLGLGPTTSAGVKFVGDQPILDSSGLELIKFTKTAVAVNEITVKNNSTGAWPEIVASGETNVALQLSGKGTGLVLVGDTGTDTSTASAGTVSKQSGTVTSEALTTAAGASWDLTLTNTKIAATNKVFASVENGTNTQGIPVVSTSTAGSGSAVIKVFNLHASQAFNGTIKVKFLVV